MCIRDRTSRDEIGVLTRNFNYMSQVLRNTISEAENERNKLATLFLHMTDGVVAFDTDGMVIHFNPAANQMLSRNLDPTCRFEEIFPQETDLRFVLALKSPEYVDCLLYTSRCV